jgi:hypothetical protein
MTKRTDPTRHLYAGHIYTPAGNTDIKARFDAIRAAQQAQTPAPNVSPIKRVNNKRQTP